MRVLAVGCHPDDLEINCYGTLARYSERGDDVFVCNVANGCMGHMVIPPDELKVIRRKEAEKAASLIGAKEYFCLDVNDLEVVSYDKELINKMIDVIRQTKPDVIITQYPNDYQRDHNETSALVFNTSFMASIPHYVTKFPVHPKLVPIYYMEPSSGNSFVPTDYVDISATIEIKLQALSCHESQIKWLADHVGKDVVATARAASMYRGKLSQVKYAEAFVRCDHALKMTTTRLLP